MMAPTIHLNGTSRDELIAQLETASLALYDAEQALAGMAPHGRDYYPQGPQALEQALAEHGARLQALQALRVEIHAIWESIL